VLALGAQVWKPLQPSLIILNLVGLYFLAAPTWSYGGSDYMDWQKYLREAVVNPQQTCVITDGRAYDPVTRYVPVGTKVASSGEALDCLGFSRIVLASNDYRLFQVRFFDEMEEAIHKHYQLVSNRTVFPAQITTYEKTSVQLFQFAPSRLDLPEQDLLFPLFVEHSGSQINGFARLDAETPQLTMALENNNSGDFLILTNYRVENTPKPGTPVFQIHFQAKPDYEDVDILLRAGEETAGWDGTCKSCMSVYEWTKRLHLLGSYAYPGAYRQYQAHVWGFPVNLAHQKFESVTITYLPTEGTGYFWGIYPDNP
jgi:hypothetical protein